MAFCSQCGKPIPDGQILCGQCTEKQEKGSSFQWAGQEETGWFDPADIQNNRAMAVISYIGIFVLIPVFAAKNSPYARYHANQGLVLFLAEVIWNVFCVILNACLSVLSLFGTAFWILSSVISSILGILSFVFLGLAIYGIVNAATGKTKPLPVLGRFTLLH